MLWCYCDLAGQGVMISSKSKFLSKQYDIVSVTVKVIQGKKFMGLIKESTQVHIYQ